MDENFSTHECRKFCRRPGIRVPPNVAKMVSRVTTIAPRISLISRCTIFARDIKISHTIFAMPWALLATFLAAGGSPRLLQLALIVLCMIFARTVAMASNRLLDAQLDAKKFPHRQSRHPQRKTFAHILFNNSIRLRFCV